MPPKWILGCQQLVELYYGVRMISSLVENVTNVDVGALVQIMQPDPRRIRYEIVVSWQDATTDVAFEIGTPSGVDLSRGESFFPASGSALAPVSGFMRIERAFLADLDAVTLAQVLQNGGSPVTVSTRETFLTPLPTDEASPITAPLG